MFSKSSKSTSILRAYGCRNDTHVNRRTPKCGVATVTNDSGTKPATVPARSQEKKARKKVDNLKEI